MIDDESIPPLVQPKGRCVRDRMASGLQVLASFVFRYPPYSHRVLSRYPCQLAD